MSQAVSTALLGILILAATFYGTLRFIVLDGPPPSPKRAEPLHVE
jgi:hypothetical protein